MSFPRYPKYKDSGVEWLGAVPEHWGIDRFKRSTTVCRNGIWGNEAQGDANDIQCVRVADFDRGRMTVNDDVPTIRNVTEIERKDRTLSRGNLLLEKSGGGELQPVGFVVLFDHPEPSVCSNFVAKVELATNMSPSYWRYCHAAAYAVRLNVRSIKQTSGIQNLDQSQYLDERAPFPPFPEQTAIASFLDAETSKIDSLIAEQRRLIELLKEKRQAVISHAVTKGLNPNAPMKPSRIEWLGDVPEQWEIKRVSYLFRASKGRHGQLLTKEYLGENAGQYPVYSGQTESEGVMGYWSEFEYDFGDSGVLFSTTVGAKAMNISHLFGKFSLSQNCMVISSTDERCRTRFFYYHLQPLFADERAKIPEYMQASFRMDDLYSYRVALPPVSEQIMIAEFLNQQTCKFDLLITEATRAIDLLQERRTALISAAVTGKIDVREFANVEAA